MAFQTIPHVHFFGGYCAISLSVAAKEASPQNATDARLSGTYKSRATPGPLCFTCTCSIEKPPKGGRENAPKMGIIKYLLKLY